MRKALLRGRDHLELGAIGVVSEGAVAIAISKGGAVKNYHHTDPNEDAAAFAIGAGGIFLAVADGHNGFEGAETALEHLLGDCAPAWTDARCALDDEDAWREAIWQAFLEINDKILKDAAERGTAPPGTTLSLAVVRPGDDQLVHALMGDSPWFEVRSTGGLADPANPADRVDRVDVVDLGFEAQRTARAAYLGHQTETSASIRERCAVGLRPLAGVRAIVLASDGLSEDGIGVADPASAVAQAVTEAAVQTADLRPLQTARAVVETALAAHCENHAGDNAAAGVVWLEPPTA